MSIGPVLLEVGSYGSCAGIFAWSIRRSALDRRIHPVLLVAIGVLAMFWIEAPYDWSMYVQFHPDLARAPDWGPLGATWQGLPAFAPAGYVMYFISPALIAAALAPRVAERYGVSRVRALAMTGLGVGAAWAFGFAMIAVRIGLWRFGRVAPWASLFSGSRYQYPLYDTLAMAIQVMAFTCFIGLRSDRGDDLIQAAIRRRRGDRPGHAVRAVGAALVVTHVLYFAVFLPHLVTKLAGLDTTVSSQELFDGVPNQPE